MEKDRSGRERPAILEYTEDCGWVQKKTGTPFPPAVATEEGYDRDSAPLWLYHHLLDRSYTVAQRNTTTGEHFLLFSLSMVKLPVARSKLQLVNVCFSVEVCLCF